MEKSLPKNWVETELDRVVFPTKGKKPERLEEYEFEDSLPYLDIKALEFNEIRQYADSKSSKKFENSDIAIVWDGARSGWVSKTYFGAIGSTITALRPICVNSDYLYYYLLEKYPFINSNARGVGIPHVDPTVLWSLCFPLPPLAEQERIANKLDALFAQLDGIRSAMERIPTLLKNFRQQVLTQAVTGKLTEEWRKEKDLEEWREETIENLSIKVGSGSTPRGGQESYLAEGIPLIRSMNVHFNGINYDGLAYLNEEQAYNLRNVEVITNDVLLNITGASIGRVCNAPIDLNGARVNQHVCIIRCNDKIKSSYLSLYLSSPKIQMYIASENYGVTRQALTKGQILNLQVLLPPLSEQQEIVRRVESLFAKADAIEEQYQTLKQKIDNLPQAILHKAFKGELVEQLPTDGDARDLLRQIEELKKGTKKK